MDRPIPFPPELWERIPPRPRRTSARWRAAWPRWRRRSNRGGSRYSRPRAPRRAHRRATRPRPWANGRGESPRGVARAEPGHAGQARAAGEAGAGGVPVKPERCHHCQPLLPGAEPQPPQHQVTASPPVQPGVTASQVHRLVCPACGEATRAEVPAGGPPGGCGPRVQARTALWTGA